MQGFGHAMARRCKAERRKWGPEIYGKLMSMVPSDGRTAKGFNHGEVIILPVRDGAALAGAGRVLADAWMEMGQAEHFVVFAELVVAMPMVRTGDDLEVTPIKRRSPGEPFPTIEGLVRDSGDELIEEGHACLDHEGWKRGKHDDEEIRAFRTVVVDGMALLPPTPNDRFLTVEWRMRSGERSLLDFHGEEPTPGWFRRLAQAAAAEVGPRTGLTMGGEAKPYGGTGEGTRGWDRLASSWTQGRARTWVEREEEKSIVPGTAARMNATSRLAAWASVRGLGVDVLPSA